MRNRNIQLLVLVLQCVWLSGYSGASHALIPSVAAGDDNSCAVDSMGQLRCWGNDSAGKLGVGRVLQSASPRLVGTGYLTASSSAGAAAISAGSAHTMALKSDGSLWAWGLNRWGQLGDGTTADRASPVAVGSFASVSGGNTHSAAVKADGSLWTWGANTAYQLGDGTITDRSTPQLVGTGYAWAVAGPARTFAIKDNGSLWAWGSNANGELGTGSTTPGFFPTLIGTDYRSIASGTDYSVAVKADGSLWAWGANHYGQLGDGSVTSSLVPRQIGTGFSAVAASDGQYHNLALKDDGTLWAWGRNWAGQIGDGTGSDSLVPKLVGAGFVAVAAGYGHSVALKSDGSLWAWGWNQYGQLGDGTTSNSAVPKQIGSGFAALSAGSGQTLALKTDGSLWAWGSNLNGELGLGSPTISTTPKPIGTGFRSVATGGLITLGVKGDDSLWAWGFNGSGWLGDGSKQARSAPTPIGSGFTSVAAGWRHSAALKSDGSLWSWGWNGSGQLGDGTTSDRLIPKLIGTDYLSVGAGRVHTVAVSGDGGLWAWGGNGNGQLGDSSTTGSLAPKQIGTGFSAVAAGWYHTVAIRKDGTLWAWGSNVHGELGDGSTVDRSAPIQVGSGFVAVAGGNSLTVGLKSDASLWAWGSNADGALGDGTLADALSPRLIGVGYLSVAAGGSHIVAVKGDGSVWVSGSNGYGQLGDGTLTTRLFTALASNVGANGPLDLLPDVANDIPADKIPPFWLEVSKGNEVSAAISYHDADLGGNGSVYAVAYLPPDSPLLASPPVVGTNPPAAVATPKANPSGLVSAVLTRSGWKQAVAGASSTDPLYSGTLTTAANSFALFDAGKFDPTKNSGIFCLGYAGSSDSSAKGLIRSVVTGSDISLADCPPIQVGPAADAQAPTLPGNLVATAAGPGQVNLSWSAAIDNVGVVHYNVYRGSTLLATLGAVTQYSDVTAQASTAYSYSVMACDAALNCSGHSTAAQVSTPAQPSMALTAGWNLLGNGGSSAMNLTSLFGDANKVASVWKWVRSGSTPGISYPAWAFYTPSADGGAAYAASKGYDSLSTIQGGEGFWVNAKTAFSVPLTAPAWILSSVFQPTQSKALTSGWNLIATGEANTASAFNKAIGATQPAPGVVPINLTTLWGWDNGSSRWYFYAPSMEAGNSLTAYVTAKNYLDFGATPFKPITGFWVNKP